MEPHRTEAGAGPVERARPAGGLLRLAARTGAALVLVVLLACSAVAVVLEILVDADELAARFAPRASAVLGRDVTVGEASLVLLPGPAVRVSDVRVDNLDGFEGPPLLEADVLRIDLAVFPLFVGRIAVRGLRVERPSVHLAIDEHGASNFGDLMPRGRGTDPGGPVGFALRRIAVSGARITYSDAPASRATTVDRASVDARLSSEVAGGWRMTAQAHSDSVHVLFADPGRAPLRAAGPSATWTLYGDEVFDRIEIRDGTLTHRNETLAVEGRISDPRGASPSLKLRLWNDALTAATLATWSGRAPASSDVSLTGIVSLDATLTAPGPRTATPVLRGEIELAGVSVLRGGESVAERLTGAIEFAPDTLTLHGLGGTFAGGPFELYGRVAGVDRMVRIETWGRPDLSVLDRLGWTPAWARFSGSATLDVVLGGSLLDPRSLTLDGTGIVAGLRIGHDRLNVPLYMPSGTVSFAEGDVFWEDVSVMAGPDVFQTTGRLNALPLPVDAWVRALSTPWTGGAPPAGGGPPIPLLEAALHGGSLDLDRLLGRPVGRSAPTYAQVAFAHLGRRTVGGFGAGVVVRERGLARPSSLPFTGSVALDLDTLFLRPFVLTEVSTIIELSPSALEVRDAAFGVWGGEGAGALTLGVGPSPAEPFALTLALDRVVAGPFFRSLTPVGDAIDGVMDLRLRLSGTTERTLLPARDGLVGEGTLVLDEGRVGRTGVTYAVADFLSSDAWADVPFERWALDFDVHDGMVEIGGSELSGSLGEATLRGVIALEGATNLSLALSIPASGLESISLRRTGIGSDVLQNLREDGDPLELGLRLSGPVAGPTLEPDASVALRRPR